MPNVNIRQLRDTRKLKAWLQAGKTVELRDRNKVIGRIVPARMNDATVKLPDFAARRNKIFGDRVFVPTENVVRPRTKRIFGIHARLVSRV